MPALLSYPNPQPAPRARLFLKRGQTATAPFSDQVWKLHRIIVSPASGPEEVKSARHRLLRELRNLIT